MARPGRCSRGISIVEVLIALVVLAAAGVGLYVGLYAYVGQTEKALETMKENRPLGYAKLAADLETLAGIRNQLDLYYSTRGQRPASKAAAVAALKYPPRFQCAGNDFTYDPASGAIALVIAEPAGCN